MLPLFLMGAALATAAPVTFTDAAATAGLHFVLDNSATAEKHMIETMPGGIATFDYDGDGLTDIFFTNGARLPGLDKREPKYWNRLFRNEGNWKFRDVTVAAGLAGEGYSMGAAAADYDNDGRVDLFVAGVYRNILYRNLGGGKFQDVTARSGIRSNRWSVTGGWFDYDNDGLLDLFVVNYSHWSAANPRFCGDTARKIRVYCHPKYFEPVANQLYRNRGDGVFEDAGARTGVEAHKGRGMGVAFADLDGDRRLDVFVTNDNLPNFLFRNLPGGAGPGRARFEETALLAGAALLDSGKPVASMGTDWRDYDNDGRPDIVLTALAGETYPLFRGQSDGGLRDATHASGLAALTVRHSGWGVGWVDFDNDGWKDLFTANSHVNDRIEQFEAFRYKEPNSVFRNLGNGRFADDSGSFEAAVRAHRGAAFADFDNDGRIDVVVSALGEPAELWRNTTADAAPRHWLRVIPRGARSNRDGIGALVTVGKQSNLMSTAVSYSSSSHYGVPFGLGGDKGPLTLTVHWPSGAIQRIDGVAPDRVLTVTEPAAP